MTKYTMINGIEFETHKSKYANIAVNNWLHEYPQTLDDCYENPSVTKQEIYAEWMAWKDDTDYVEHFGIRSYNVFGFTLCGLFLDSETFEILGLLNITKTKNELILL